jgi:HK97 family phage major capsid protein
MSKYTDALIERRNTIVAAAQDITDTAADDGGRDLTEEEAAKVKAYNAEIAELEAKIEDFAKAEDRSAKFAESFAGRRQRAEVREREQRRDAVENPEGKADPIIDKRSVGQRFVESDAFQNWNGHGTSAPVVFNDFLGIEQRAAITTDDLNILPYQYTGRIGYVTTTPFLDAIGREVVNSNSVTYIDWGTGDPLAGGPIAEGDLKPEAAITPTEVPLVIETYAHWKAITRQAIEDYPRIQSIVEGKLRGGLANKLESVAATTLTTATLNEVTNADLLAGIRQAVGEIQAEGFTPNAVVLNPADFAALDIAAAAASNSGPTAFGNFWGLRPIAAGAIPEGSAYVGDFKQGFTWFDRNVTSVYMTDSHADYFIRNLLVVLGEARSAFAVTDSAALAKVTATAPVGGTTARTTSK